MKSLYQCAMLILSRAVIFTFVPYNAPVRTWVIVKFAKVNESPIDFGKVGRRVYVSKLLPVLILRRATDISNKTQLLGCKK